MKISESIKIAAGLLWFFTILFLCLIYTAFYFVFLAVSTSVIFLYERFVKESP